MSRFGSSFANLSETTHRFEDPHNPILMSERFVRRAVNTVAPHVPKVHYMCLYDAVDTNVNKASDT
jgi:hypothetical protein